MNLTTSTAFTRRSVLRAGAFGSAGLAAAALLGCGGSKTPAGNSSASNTSGAPGEGIPKNIKRADGFNAKIGQVAINNKKVIMGGTYRESASDTSRENDPDVSISGADWQHMADRLVIANGWTMKIQPDMLVSWELVDKQGLQIVMKLRPGIKTHPKPPMNGRIYTAKDVAFSIMRKAGKIDPKAASKYA